MNKWLALCFLVAYSNLAVAQTTNPVHLSAALLASLPDPNSFGSENLDKANAGHANFGAGIGVGVQNYLAQNFFIPVNAEYVRHSSNLISGIVDRNNLVPGAENATVVEDINWHHFLFTGGLGYAIGNETFRVIPTITGGISQTNMTASTHRIGNSTIEYDKSGQAGLCYGASVSVIISEKIIIEASYINFGSREFFFLERDNSSAFTLPIAMTNFKIGYVLFKSKTVD